MTTETCKICEEEGHDRRTLRMQYGWELQELSPKFKREEVVLRGADGAEKEETFFSISSTCKGCRGALLSVIRKWANGGFVRKETGQSPGRNIPVRVDGATVMMDMSGYVEHLQTRLD